MTKQQDCKRPYILWATAIFRQEAPFPLDNPEEIITRLRILDLGSAQSEVKSRFTAPSNVFFLPPEFSTVNCCPPECDAFALNFSQDSRGAINVLPCNSCTPNSSPPTNLMVFLDVDGDFSPAVPSNDTTSYLPCSTLQGAGATTLPQSVTLIAGFVDANGAVQAPPGYVVDATFTLSETSAFKRRAMYFGSQTEKNFSLSSSSDLDSKSSAFTSDGTARITLYCKDYGGFTKARA